MQIGDVVTVTDTAAKKDREGFVRKTYSNGSVDVWVTRYKTVISFDAQGTTPKGRFLLKNEAGR